MSSLKTNHKFWRVALAIPIIGCLLWSGMPARAAKSADRKVLYYQDSMHPWVKSDQPGKCTICAMDLTPIYEGQTGFGVSNNLVILSSNGITVLNVQAEAVQRRALRRSLRVAGTLEANETRKTIISAPAPGRIQALAVEYVGMEVHEGQTLITFFSPELQQRRAYFRAAGPNPRGQSNDLAAAALKTDPFSADMVAPQSGTVVERKVYVGQYVAEGDRLLTIVDSSVLWFNFDVYEGQLPWLEVGQTIDVVVPAIPGKVFPATITFLEPTVNEVTRTVKARSDIRNPVVTVNGKNKHLLKYGMYAEGRVRAEAPDVLVVPRSAILFPGGAAYVYTDKGGGAYERRRVSLGRQGDELWEVLSGLDEGDRVVTSGNVLIDAQAQINRGADEMAVQGEDAAANVSMAAAETRRSTSMENPRTVQQSQLTEAPSSGTNTPSATTNRTALHRQTDVARMAIRDEMWRMRMAAIAAGDQPTNSEAAPLTANQQQAIQAFMTEADGISRALAADDLAQFNQQVAKVSAVLPPLRRELAAPHRWAEWVQRLTMLNQGESAKDLETARTRFLPFSTAVVELAKSLRKEIPAFAGLKIYHCPMAPKPGLWLQLKGPLRNPFYGAKMLTCGEEVGLAASGADANPAPTPGEKSSVSPK